MQNLRTNTPDLGDVLFKKHGYVYLLYRVRWGAFTAFLRLFLRWIEYLWLFPFFWKKFEMDFISLMSFMGILSAMLRMSSEACFQSLAEAYVKGSSDECLKRWQSLYSKLIVFLTVLALIFVYIQWDETSGWSFVFLLGCFLSKIAADTWFHPIQSQALIRGRIQRYFSFNLFLEVGSFFLCLILFSFVGADAAIVSFGLSQLGQAFAQSYFLRRHQKMHKISRLHTPLLKVLTSNLLPSSAELRSFSRFAALGIFMKLEAVFILYLVVQNSQDFSVVFLHLLSPLFAFSANWHGPFLQDLRRLGRAGLTGLFQRFYLKLALFSSVLIAFSSGLSFVLLRWVFHPNLHHLIYFPTVIFILKASVPILVFPHIWNPQWRMLLIAGFTVFLAYIPSHFQLVPVTQQFAVLYFTLAVLFSLSLLIVGVRKIFYDQNITDYCVDGLVFLYKKFVSDGGDSCFIYLVRLDKDSPRFRVIASLESMNLSGLSCTLNGQTLCFLTKTPCDEGALSVAFGGQLLEVRSDRWEKQNHGGLEGFLRVIFELQSSAHTASTIASIKSEEPIRVENGFFSEILRAMEFELKPGSKRVGLKNFPFRVVLAKNQTELQFWDLERRQMKLATRLEYDG